MRARTEWTVQQEFQSLIGRLETVGWMLTQRLQPCSFQSLIGRLETCNGLVRVPWHLQFQSLIGRLETLQTSPGPTWASRFQSLIGRLETALPSRGCPRAHGVSIPHR